MSGPARPVHERASLLAGALLALAAVAAAPGARAGALQSATLSLEIGTAAALVFPAGGTVAGSAASGASVTLAAGSAFAGTQTLAVPPGVFPPLTKVVVKIGGNGAGSFLGNPLFGNALFTGTALAYISLTPAPALTVPLLAGSPGTVTASRGGVQVTLENHGWTSAATTVTGIGSTPATGTAKATGMVVTGSPGTVTLKSGTRIVTNLGLNVPAFWTLQMSFDVVPEPAGALLLAAGALTLATAGFARRRRPRPPSAPGE
jgi:hypothetical protein